LFQAPEITRYTAVNCSPSLMRRPLHGTIIVLVFYLICTCPSFLLPSRRRTFKARNIAMNSVSIMCVCFSHVEQISCK